MIHWEKIAPSTNGAEINGYSHAKEQCWPPSSHLTRILTGSVSQIQMKDQEHTFFTEWQWFLSYNTKTQVTKENISTLDFTKIKNFYASNDTNMKVKRQ